VGTGIPGGFRLSVDWGACFAKTRGERWSVVPLNTDMNMGKIKGPI